MIILHHLNNSRSQRILWLLEELGCEYTVKTYQRDSQTNLAPAALKAIHPLGRSPILTTPYGEIAESGAIIEYLVKYHGNDTFSLPTTPQAEVDYWFWLHFSEGSLMPPMVANLVLNRAREKASGFLIKGIVNKLVDGIIDAYFGPNLKSSLMYIESYLSENEWFAGGQPSGADVQMIFPLESLVATGRADNMPAIKAYVERIHARPAYKRALEKGGEYAYAS